MPSSATYKFGISCDDGCSLFVNNVNLANDNGACRCHIVALLALRPCLHLPMLMLAQESSVSELVGQGYSSVRAQGGV